MSRAPALIVEMPFDDGFENERHQRKECEQRRDREGGDEIIFIVEDLDMQRHRVGMSAQMAENDRHRAQLPHRARISEQYPIELHPPHIWNETELQSPETHD